MEGETRLKAGKYEFRMSPHWCSIDDPAYDEVLPEEGWDVYSESTAYWCLIKEAWWVRVWNKIKGIWSVRE